MLTLVFAAHLLAVNVATGAPFAALWFDVASRRHGALGREAGRWLLRQSLVWLTVGAALGAAAVGLIWLDGWKRWFESAARVPVSRYHFFLPELAFFYVCIAGQHWLWSAEPRSAARAWSGRLLGLFAATNLAYHFPPLFAVINVFAGRAATKSATFDFLAAMRDPEVLALVCHFLLASLAAAGVALLGYAARMLRRGERPDDARRIAVWGGRAAVVPTVLQLLVGTWALMVLAPRSRDALMGGDGAAASLFLLSLALALWLMHRLAAIALGEVDRKSLIAAMTLFAAVVLLMTAMRERARSAVDARPARLTSGALAVRPCDAASGGPLLSAAEAVYASWRHSRQPGGFGRS